ncbi:EamA family transporter [Adhaeribacter aerolatus]|nr:EamA family transporter [Adhaeribacter aerolatus]
MAASPMQTAIPQPPKWQIYLAFAAIYVIWGSTYLGIRFTNESIPPFLMSGMRFVIAGSCLYLYARIVNKAPAPTWPNIKAAAMVGFLLILIGNGGVAYAELTIPSSIAALLIATSPVWFVLLGWLFFGNARPNSKVISGLVLGLAGMVVLIGPGQLTGHALDMLGLGIIVFSTIGWTVGSLYSSVSKTLAPPLIHTALQMLAGGIFLLLMATLRGEVANFHVEQVSLKSWLAFGYLIVFGSLVGFNAYSWLIRVVPPSQASTYAYVNPLVAVILGWLFGGEAITWQMLLAGAFILPGVILILRAKAKNPKPEVVPEEVT